MRSQKDAQNSCDKSALGWKRPVSFSRKELNVEFLRHGEYFKKIVVEAKMLELA